LGENVKRLDIERVDWGKLHAVCQTGAIMAYPQGYELRSYVASRPLFREPLPCDSRCRVYLTP
jgi:hypothetical protein